jgi:hypothetical protein
LTKKKKRCDFITFWAKFSLKKVVMEITLKLKPWIAGSRANKPWQELESSTLEKIFGYALSTIGVFWC